MPGKGKARARARSPEPEEDKHPVVRMSYGAGRCHYCRREYDRTRYWSKYCSDYCRVMHWHVLHRRKTPPGAIVEVDGRATIPMPVLDKDLEAQFKESQEKLMREYMELQRAAEAERASQKGGQ